MQQSVDTSIESVDVDLLESMAARRRSIRRSVLMLVLCLLALIGFILATADIRRRTWAIMYATEYGKQLESRLQADGLLPLDLTAKPAGTQDLPKIYRFEWLSEEQVHQYRKVQPPLIVAQTIPVARRFASTGRAVVVFDQGLFRVEWMGLQRFDDLLADQEARQSGN